MVVWQIHILFSSCTCVCAFIWVHMPQCQCGGQKTCGGGFSLSTMWILGTKLRSSGTHCTSHLPTDYLPGYLSFHVYMYGYAYVHAQSHICVWVCAHLSTDTGKGTIRNQTNPGLTAALPRQECRCATSLIWQCGNSVLRAIISLWCNN